MTVLGTKETRRRRSGRPDPARPDHRAEASLIRELWRNQKDRAETASLAADERAYLDAHFSTPLALSRRLAMIDWLAASIQPGDRVLEWGCRHAVDSCIYRRRFGASLSLFGCDYVEPSPYRAFHEYCELQYQTINHPYRLDYPDATFDVVTSNGVWEHVEEEERSLAEIYRILRPGGRFLVACLPNKYSYTEALQRKLGHPAHDRLYTVASATDLMRAVGFEVLTSGRRLIVPTQLNGFPEVAKAAYSRIYGLVWATNRVLERTWPISLIASNLMFTARRPPQG